MSFQANPFSLPNASTQLTTQAGLPTNFFWKYLLALFNRTGGSNGTTYQAAPGLSATGLIGAGATATAGATQKTSLALGADWNQITSAPTGAGFFSGVVLPVMQPGSDISVWNDTANKLLVYPPIGSQIGSGGSVNASVTLNAGELAYFQCWSSTLIIIPYTNAGPL